MQFSPLLKKTLPSPFLTAFSISQSAKMISGDLPGEVVLLIKSLPSPSQSLPPSSSEHFLRLDSAHDLMMLCPISVEPVKPSFLTRGWSAMAWPQTLPDPGSTLITPGGIPAFADSSANLMAVRGDTWAGFITTVLPFKLSHFVQKMF